MALVRIVEGTDDGEITADLRRVVGDPQALDALVEQVRREGSELEASLLSA